MDLSEERDEEPKKFMCSNCEFIGSESKSLQDHKKTVHNQSHDNEIQDDSSWLCKDCSYQTNKESNLRIHIEKSHVFICTICNKTFTFKTPFMIHKRNEHDESVDICEDYLNDKCPYEKEKCWYHHREKDKPKHTQPEASGSTNNQHNMATQINRSNDAMKFKPCKFLPNCPFGEKCFYSHKPVSAGVLVCYECGYEVKSVHELMSHRKTEHKTKFVKSFKTKLADSMISHVGSVMNNK